MQRLNHARRRIEPCPPWNLRRGCSPAGSQPSGTPSLLALTVLAAAKPVVALFERP